MHKLSRLQELVTARQVIRVTPKHRPEEKLYGIPLSVSDEFILLHEVREFHLDGYLVIPLANVRGVRKKESEETTQRILEAEGALKDLGLSDPVCLGSFSEFFGSLQAGNIFVSVEASERVGEWIEDFFVLGRVKDVRDSAVMVQPFDALGRWEKSAQRLPYRRILSVTFNNEYMNVFSRYVK
ncbi:MAG: hypothetical protein WCI73_12690 [Phycisphaerae bacterium]